MQKRLVFLTLMIFGFGVIFASCAGMKAKPTEDNFKNPVIALDSVMVPQYDGYWYYSKGVKPTKGDPGDRGAPLPLSFLFTIENPNPYPVKLDGFKFTVGFEGFDMVTVNNQDTFWIPAKTTDQVRANTMITVRSGLLSLLVTGGFKLKDKGWSPWDALERWWTGVPDASVPVTVHEGAFTFGADGVVKVLPFEATYP